MQSSDEEDSESSRDTHEYLEPPVNSDEDGDNRDDDGVYACFFLPVVI